MKYFAVACFPEVAANRNLIDRSAIEVIGRVSTEQLVRRHLEFKEK